MATLVTGNSASHYPDRPSDDHTCVIGAGISGLAVAGTLRSRGIPTTVLERSDEVGGLWRHRGPGDRGPSYGSLHLNTSKGLTGYSDFPVPDAYPRYPSHQQMASYLRSYAEHKGVTEHVEFGSDVLGVTRSPDGTWAVATCNSTGGSEVRHFRHVVVASGHHWSPRVPDIPGMATFTGRAIHSADYSTPDGHAGKRVAVIGFGNTAADLAVELSRVCEKTFVVQRRGVHVVPKTMFGTAIDEIASSPWWARMSFEEQRRLIELSLRVIRGDLTDYGLLEPDHRVFGGPLTISDELLSRINHGAVIPKRAVERIEGPVLHFADGSAEEVDEIVHCTGFHIEFPFLPDGLGFEPGGQLALYQRVVPPRETGLYFAGLIRPFGAITRLVEEQGRWIADLVQGRAALPPVGEMEAEVQAHLEAARARYGRTAGDSVQVDFARYLAALRERRGAPAAQPA